jgi:hypothetical protein
VVRPPRLDFFFLKNKICNEGILEKKKERLKWSNYNNLKVWEGGEGEGGLSVTFKTLEVKVQMSR